MSNDKAYDRHVNIWINGKEVTNNISSIKKEMFNLTNELARTTRGTKEYNEKAAELGKVKGILKEHQDNIRATGSLWDKLGNAVPASVSKMASAFKALLANPVVLVITLIVAAVTALIKAFKSTDSGSVAFAARMEQVKAVLDVLRQRLISVTDAIGHVFKGEWKEAAASMKEAFTGIADQIKSATAAAYEYQTVLDSISDAESNYVSQSAENRNKIAKLEYTAQDRNKSTEERRKALQEALAIGREEVKTAQNFAKQKLDNEINYLAGKAGLRGEDVLGFIKMTDAEQANASGSLKTLRNNNEEKFNEIEKLYAAWIDADTKFYDENKRNLSRMTAFEETERNEKLKTIQLAQKWTDEYFENERKRNEESLKDKVLMEKWTAEFFENERKRSQKKIEDLELMNKWTEEYFEKEQKRELTDIENSMIIKANNVFAVIDLEKKKNGILREQEIEDAEKTGASVQLINEKYAKLDKDLDEKKLKTKIGLASEFFNNVATIAGKQTAVGKAAAIAAATIDTYASATASYKALAGIPIVGPVLGFAAAAAAIAAGLLNVRQILKVNPNNKWTGGYAEAGGKYEPAGIFHKGEYIVNADMVASPQYGPMVAALEEARVNSLPGYANGGGPGMSSSGSGTAGSSSMLIGSDPELKNLIRENIRVNKMLLRDGVTTRFDYLSVNNVRKGIKNLEKIESDVTM